MNEDGEQLSAVVVYDRNGVTAFVVSAGGDEVADFDWHGQDGPLALLSITEGMTMEQLGKIPGGRVTWHSETYEWHDEDDMEIA